MLQQKQVLDRFQIPFTIHPRRLEGTVSHIFIWIRARLEVVRSHRIPTALYSRSMQTINHVVLLFPQLALV